MGYFACKGVIHLINIHNGINIVIYSSDCIEIDTGELGR